MKNKKHILSFSEISKKDVLLVGGKNASLGEMFSLLTKKGVNIPNGFCITAQGYWYFLKENQIEDKLEKIFKKFDKNSIKSLQRTSQKARNLILNAEFPTDLKEEIISFYEKLGGTVAVRSSATAEDTPNASFAGQHETYLNVTGKWEVLKSVKKCMASLFTARAISYREETGFKHLEIALSVGVQRMVRSDLSSSGVMFSLDTESGFENVVLINSIYGIGEMIVQGKITPDEFFVFKPTLKNNFQPIVVKNLGRKNKKFIYSNKGGLKEVIVEKEKQLEFSLTDKEVLRLAKWAMIIEKHYGFHQDIEWAKDGKTGKLFIVQARPETVHSQKKQCVLEEYVLETTKNPILRGIAIGDKIGIGKVHYISNISKIAKFKAGEVLVAKMTDPDWVPIMKMASAIVTDEGGKTAHAAIVARELGIPCVVGTHKATKLLKSGQLITVDCTEGLKGKIFEGKVKFKVIRRNLNKIPKLKTKIMMNIGAPDIAFRSSFLPNDGVGLAREEFIIAEKIKVHPLALYHYKDIKKQSINIKDKKQKKQILEIIRKIDNITKEHQDKKQYFIKELAEGVGQIACAFFPKPVIVRLSDFKTNEYAQLVGGELFEPKEQNPMLGWRGASRYYHPEFKPAFLMELASIKRVIHVFGLNNIKIMIPFCRTIKEGKKVLQIIKEAGLGKIDVYVMGEIPSNVILIEEFLKIFDGISIGSNDLTQLTMGLDRDNGDLSTIADERNDAVKELIKRIIKVCKQKKKYCGICGQAPSDFIEFAKFLQKEGIESISLSPETIIKTILKLKK